MPHRLFKASILLLTLLAFVFLGVHVAKADTTPISNTGSIISNLIAAIKIQINNLKLLLADLAGPSTNTINTGSGSSTTQPPPTNTSGGGTTNTTTPPPSTSGTNNNTTTVPPVTSPPKPPSNSTGGVPVQNPAPTASAIFINSIGSFQEFLDKNGFPVAPDGFPGSLGNTTEFAGLLTQRAWCGFEVNKLGLDPTNPNCGVTVGPWAQARMQELGVTFTPGFNTIYQGQVNASPQVDQVPASQAPGGGEQAPKDNPDPTRDCASSGDSKKCLPDFCAQNNTTNQYKTCKLIEKECLCVDKNDNPPPPKKYRCVATASKPPACIADVGGVTKEECDKNCNAESKFSCLSGVCQVLGTGIEGNSASDCLAFCKGPNPNPVTPPNPEPSVKKGICRLGVCSLGSCSGSKCTCNTDPECTSPPPQLKCVKFKGEFKCFSRAADDPPDQKLCPPGIGVNKSCDSPTPTPTPTPDALPALPGGYAKGRCLVKNGLGVCDSKGTGAVCTTNSECTTVNHSACVVEKGVAICKKFSGGGANKCNTDANCKNANHTACLLETKQCYLEPGGGFNQCKNPDGTLCF